MKRFGLIIIINFLALYCVLLCSAPVFAASRTWDGGGVDNNWSTCANWSSDACPAYYDTVVFDGTSSKNAVVTTDIAEIQSLTITLGYTGTITLQHSITVGLSGGNYGGFSQAGGTFDVNGQVFTFNGNFTRTGGTFSPSGGTVVLGGKKQIISGSTTFYNLYAVSGSNELIFTAGTTQTITGELRIRGLSAISPVYMHSTVAGQKWYIIPQGTFSVSNVDMQDGTNSNGTVILTGNGSFDRGNNTGWIFPGLVTPVQTLDMANPNNWNIRFDGPVTNDLLALGGILSDDLDGDNKPDLIITNPDDNHLDRIDCGATYVIYNSTLQKHKGKGVVLDLADSANYDAKIIGPASGTKMGGFGAVKIADLKGDGSKFLMVSVPYTDFNSRNNSGSVYVIPLSLLSTIGSDKVLDLADTNNFTLRFDGAAASHYLGYQTVVESAQLDEDGKEDIIFTTKFSTYNGRSPSAGSVYIVYNSLFKDFLNGTNKTYDLNTSTGYNIRFDGPALGGYLGMYRGFAAADLRGTGKPDILFAETSARDLGGTLRGSLYVIYNENYRQYAGTGNIVDLLQPSAYNVRFVGARDRDSFANYGPFPIADANGDGELELFVGSFGFLHSDLEHAGALYVIPSKIFKDTTGTGNLLYMSDTNNFSVRYDGVEYWGLLSDMNVSLSDYFNTGKYDIVTGGPVHPNGFEGTEQGYVYIIKNSQYKQYKGRGNIVKMSDTRNYSLLYKGVLGSHLITTLSPFTGIRNLYGTGSNDRIFSAHYANYNGRSHSGSVYIVYNFPHTISATTGTTSSTGLKVTGTISALDSVTTVKGVQYSIDTASYSGAWKSCSASDGSFNSTSEKYSCNVDLSSSKTGTHTVRIRAYDSIGAYTPVSKYKTVPVTKTILGTLSTASTEISPSPTPSDILSSPIVEITITKTTSPTATNKVELGKRSKSGTLLIVIVTIVGGIGIFWWLLVLKKKKVES